MVCKFDKNNFKIVELDVLRGIPGNTFFTTITARDKEEAIKNFYELHPNASKTILVAPDECVSIHAKGVKIRITKKR